MGDFGRKIDRFIEIFVEQRGYVRVLEGLQNTVMIAGVGLLVGVLIGTLIASVRVMPKYKLLPRVLNGFVAFMWGCFAERQWLCSFWCATMYCFLFWERI